MKAENPPQINVPNTGMYCLFLRINKWKALYKLKALIPACSWLDAKNRGVDLNIYSSGDGSRWEVRTMSAYLNKS